MTAPLPAIHVHRPRVSARDAESARLDAARWGRKAASWVWLLKTTQPTEERAMAAEARAHEAGMLAARAGREYLGQSA